VIFRLDASCYNEKTILCPSDQKQKGTSGIITLNYNLTPSEESLKGTFGQKLETFSKILAEADANAKAGDALFNAIPESFERQKLEKKSIELTKDISHYRMRLYQAMELWTAQNYDQLPDALTSQDELEINMTREVSYEYTNATVDLARFVNQNTGLMDGFEAKKPELLSFALFLADRPNPATRTLHSNISLLAEDYRQARDSGSELILHEEMRRIDQNALDLTHAYRSIRRKEDLLLSYGEKLLFLKNVSLNSSAKGCSLMAEIIDKMDAANTKTVNLTNETLDEAESGITYTALNLMQNVSSEDLLFLEINSIIPSNASNFSSAILSITRYQRYVDHYCPDGSTSFRNISLYLLKQQNNTRDFINTTLHVPKVTDTFIPPNPPLCCLRSLCTPCSSSSAHPPVLFIHGHMLNDANDPESSAHIFVPIQRKLEGEGMIDFGEFYLTDQNIPYGDWGRTNASITVRSSYYYLTYLSLGEYIITTQKSENIETYALRLHDMIESLKYRTGKPNITIIAHSMGGLVVRQYLALFGSGSVDQVILIGSPNQGISGTIRQFCKTFGSARECDDMTEGSIFLSRLNANPPQAGVFMIRGTGCSMDGGDGDGIVLSKNAVLPGAENIAVNGTCERRFGTSLHSDLLDPEQYPLTYELIVKILKKEYPLMPR
jgi:hypothetical protein